VWAGLVIIFGFACREVYGLFLEFVGYSYSTGHGQPIFLLCIFAVIRRYCA
jgi:hypothetical protein